MSICGLPREKSLDTSFTVNVKLNILSNFLISPITHTLLPVEPSRQSDWDSIAAVHRGEKVVTTWNYKRSTMGAHRLVHKRFSDPEHVHSEAKVGHDWWPYSKSVASRHKCPVFIPGFHRFIELL